MQLLLRLDAFRKIPAELTNPTYHGAYLTMLAYAVMALLFILELSSYMTTNVTKTVELDNHYANQIWIDFDVVMHELPCKYTNVVIRDIVGQKELEVLDSKITKERTDVRTGSVKGIHVDDPLSADAGSAAAANSNNDVRHSHTKDGAWTQPALEEDWIAKSSDQFKHTDFDAVIQYHDFTFLNFYAEWCIHCRRFAPIWVEAEKKADIQVFRDKSGKEVVAKFLRINCVEYQQSCAKAGIRAYPTIRIYKRDATFSVYHGERKSDVLLKFMTEFIRNEQITTGQRSVHVGHHSAIEEGCRVHGELKVRRVPGYFLLEAGAGLASLEPSMTNVSHRVNHLWFLDDREQLKDYVKKTARHVTKDILQNVQPMKLQEYTTYKAHTAPHHFMNVIPTLFDGSVIVYQSTVQSHISEVDASKVPQARFSYNFSPMQIRVSTASRPLYDFMTSVFAIVGGTYTFVSLVDKFWDTVSASYKRKINVLD